MAKISVIVPVYNSERYLSRCIDSILNQSYNDFELILINDGSKDKSLDIIRKYENQDIRIKVIDNKNRGVSETRNIGVNIAEGEYIQFIDSDDFIEKDMLKDTLDIIETKEVDLVITGFFLDINTKKRQDTSIQTFEQNISKSSKDIAINLLKRLNGTYINSPVNKLYKREVIVNNNLLMDKKLDLGEDLVFNLDYFKHCKSVAFCNNCYYHYCMNLDENLTSKFRENKLELMKLLYDKCEQYLISSNVDAESIKDLNSIFIKWMYYCFIDLNSKGCNLKLYAKYKYIKECIDKYKYITSNSNNSNLLRILKLSLVSPILVIILSKVIYFIKNNMRRIIYR